MIKMISIKLNGNVMKRCAFCKYWYDPANQHIQPQDPRHSLWKYDLNAKCKCMKRNVDMGAGQRCDKFENKIT